MDLIALAKNPVPSGATTGYFDCPGRLKLRFARWEATRGPQRGTVCLFQGRGEFIEKYFEVVADLRRRGFGVATMDWRGQGGSEPHAVEPQQGLRALVRRFRPGPRLLHEGGRAAELRAALHRRGALDGRPHPAAQCLAAQVVVLAHGAERADDRHRRDAPRRLARRGARLCGDPCRPSASDRPTCATATTGRSSSSPSRATRSPRIATAICATSRCWRKRRSSGSARRPSPGCARPIAPWRGCDRPTIRTAWRCRC